MGDLSVTVRMNGFVVEDRVLPVRRLVRVGEAEGAEVSFPGADVVVVRMGDRLALRGRHLEEGEQMDIALGPVSVTVEHTVRAHFPLEWAGLWDWRFCAAAVIMITAGAWVDAADAWVDTLPERESAGELIEVALGEAMSKEVVGKDASDANLAAVSAPGDAAGQSTLLVTPALAEGPRHLPDDLVTGIGWYAWYRAAVPEDDQLDGAYERFAWSTADRADRRRLAWAAYDRDEYEEAAWHYQWLVERDPSDVQARLRVAWAKKRMGHHDEEVAQYQAVLELEPGNTAALGGLAVALARKGRLDAASETLDQLRATAPMSSLTHLATTHVLALQGRDSEALRSLDDCIQARRQLSSELQLELRRDLALDPALSRLRRDRRTLTMLHRHLAAAAPRPVR